MSEAGDYLHGTALLVAEGAVLIRGASGAGKSQLALSLMAEARRRGLKIKFSRRMGHVYPRAIELVSKGLVDVQSMVSHRFALADSPEAFRLHAENAPGMIKSLIFPNGMNNQ